MVRESKYRNSHVGNGCIFWKKKNKQTGGFPQAPFPAVNTFLSFCLLIFIFPTSPESSLRELEASLGVP